MHEKIPPFYIVGIEIEIGTEPSFLLFLEDFQDFDPVQGGFLSAGSEQRIYTKINKKYSFQK